MRLKRYVLQWGPHTHNKIARSARRARGRARSLFRQSAGRRLFPESIDIVDMEYREDDQDLEDDDFIN